MPWAPGVSDAEVVRLTLQPTLATVAVRTTDRVGVVEPFELDPPELDRVEVAEHAQSNAVAMATIRGKGRRLPFTGRSDRRHTPKFPAARAS